MTAPEGDWYFQRDPASDEWEEPLDEDSESEQDSDTFSDFSDDSFWERSDAPETFNERRESRAVGNHPVRLFRTKPDAHKIGPLLTAMARAAGQMPKLRIMSLKGEVYGPKFTEFEVVFCAPGQSFGSGQGLEDVDKPRLYWVVGKWRPDEAIIQLWRDVKGVDGDLLVRFIDE